MCAEFSSDAQGRRCASATDRSSWQVRSPAPWREAEARNESEKRSRARPKPIEPVRPICTPQPPSSHTCALDFFLAGEAYDLIASDRWWFGAEAWAATTKRLGSRHLGRQVVGKCHVPRSAIAKT